MSNSEITLALTEEYANNWLRCRPIDIGDLFSFESINGIKRYDAFNLAENGISQLLTLDVYNGEAGNIDRLSVVMGVKKAVVPPADDAEQTRDIFQPVLEAKLKKAINGSTGYYFTLSPVDELFTLRQVHRRYKIPVSQNNEEIVDMEEQISPKVAQLLILKWQGLTTANLISAFEGLTGLNEINLAGDKVELVLYGQKIARVRRYNYDALESAKIIERLRNRMQATFTLHLGAGLVDPIFHPYNFRPIIKIDGELPSPVVRPDFFDTSRPCPPFCEPLSVIPVGPIVGPE
ncbi:MAG: hypothetical protein AAF990_21090 [Bacteroidota bacterium]